MGGRGLLLLPGGGLGVRYLFWREAVGEGKGAYAAVLVGPGGGFGGLSCWTGGLRCCGHCCFWLSRMVGLSDLESSTYVVASDGIRIQTFWSSRILI